MKPWQFCEKAYAVFRESVYLCVFKNFFEIRTVRSAFCYMKDTENFVPDKKQDESPQYCGSDIDKNGGKIAGSGGNIPEDNLLHGIVGVDIEHVDCAVLSSVTLIPVAIRQQVR